MLKKDRIAIAKIIKHSDASDYHDGCMGKEKILFTSTFVKELANYIIIDNPCFNAKEFFNACGITD